MSFKVPEKYRIEDFPGMVHKPSRKGDLNGYFLIPPSLARRLPIALRCMASANPEEWEHMRLGGVVPPGPAWEHVSVSLQPPMMTRCPTWEEMCYVKDLFWDREDAVFQIHPPASEYVNDARFCLHLWRPIGIELPRPPTWCVGDQVVGR